MINSKLRPGVVILAALAVNILASATAKAQTGNDYNPYGAVLPGFQSLVLNYLPGFDDSSQGWYIAFPKSQPSSLPQLIQA